MSRALRTETREVTNDAEPPFTGPEPPEEVDDHNWLEDPLLA